MVRFACVCMWCTYKYEHRLLNIGVADFCTDKHKHIPSVLSQGTCPFPWWDLTVRFQPWISGQKQSQIALSPT